MAPWLTYLIVAAILVVASVLVVLILRLSRAVVEAQTLIARITQLTPRVDRILAETEAELAELRQVTQKVNGIADSALGVTRKAADVVSPALDAAGSLTKPLKYITAAVAGVQAVMQFYKQRNNHQPEDGAEAETEGEAASPRSITVSKTHSTET